MQRHLQLELKLDLRFRLPVPSVYVPQFYISWHWDPDALARWHTMMSYLVSFLELHPPAQRYCWSTGLRWEADGKARSRFK